MTNLFIFWLEETTGVPNTALQQNLQRNSLQGQPRCVHRAVPSAAESYAKEDCILLETSGYKNEFQAMKERSPNNTFVFLNSNSWKNIKTNKPFCLRSHHQPSSTDLCHDSTPTLTSSPSLLIISNKGYSKNTWSDSPLMKGLMQEYLQKYNFYRNWVCAVNLTPAD